MIYARAIRNFGTNADIVILSDSPFAGMVTVPTIAVFILRRLISKAARGINLSTLHGREIAALSDIEKKLGIRLSRSRRAGHVALVNTVQVVDQRTLSREVA